MQSRDRKRVRGQKTNSKEDSQARIADQQVGIGMEKQRSTLTKKKSGEELERAKKAETLNGDTGCTVHFSQN